MRSSPSSKHFSFEIKNVQLPLMSVVLKTADLQQLSADMQQRFGDKVFQTVITKTVKFPDSAVAGEPITSFAPGSQGAEAYRQFAREVLQRLG